MKPKDRKAEFLPVSREDMAARGWEELDIIIVSGDAYVDHPSWASAVLGRLLENRGYRVGIIAQPDWHDPDSIKRLGCPRLLFAVSGGNMDSMVNHYTADRKKRHDDMYSPGGQAGFRPDRATIVYSNLVRQAYPGVPLIIGGVEASLRRLAHYDYWSDKVRRSILVDSRADLLVYGMGEYTLWEVARKLKAGRDIAHLRNLRGTCYLTNQPPEKAVELPSFEEVASDKKAFARATKMMQSELNPFNANTLIQLHGDRWVVQTPPPEPLSTQQLDEIYELGYLRRSHPSYDNAGGIPGLKPVQFSMVTHRGCFGGCSFCALGMHQGKMIQNRSPASIAGEAAALTKHPDFKGTIPDVGAPSANMYGLEGINPEQCRQCRRSSCLFPGVCKNLDTDHTPSVKLWKRMRQVTGIKHLYVASGIRYDLVLRDKSKQYLRDLCHFHVGGQLKIAPEHVSARVTRLMHKPAKAEYKRFMEDFKRINQELGQDQYIIPYFISAHPGCGLEDTIELAEFVRDHLQYYPEQVQNFTPTPMTVSTCMYYTGINPDNNQVVYIPRQERERKMQRSLIQYRNRANHNLVREALRAADRSDLIGSGPKSLVPGNKSIAVDSAPKNTNKPVRQRRKKDMHGR